MVKYTILVLFSIFVVAYTQSLGLPLNTGQSGSVPTCKYEFTVPDTKGACNRAATSLTTKVDAIKQDLDRTRLQYISQNSIIQATLAKVQGDTSMYVSKVQDLSKELTKLQNAVSNAGTGSSVSGGNSQYINKLVHDTKDLLTQAVQDINNKIYNLTYQFQSNAVQESKVNTAIETQINQQASQISQTQQKVLNLENQLKNLQSKPINPSATGSPVSNMQLLQLQQQYQKLEADIKKLDSQQQTQFRGLQSKTNGALLKLANQSQEINTVKQDTKSAVAQIQAASQQAADAKNATDQLKQSYGQQLTVINSEVNSIQKNISDTNGELAKLINLFQVNRLQSFQDKAKLNTVMQQATQLANSTTALRTQIQAQSTELVRLMTIVNNLTTTGTGTGNGTAGNAGLQAAFNQFQSKTNASISKTDAKVQQLNTMVTTLLQQITPLLTHGSG